MDAVATPIDLESQALEVNRQRHHPDCFVCGPGHPFGLKLSFFHSSEGRVEASFPCGWFLQGYPGRLHGGIVSTVLDSAMVHALMAVGVEAVTADLQVRFLLPVELGKEAQVVGERRLQRGPIHHMTASLTQGGKVRATARARFFETRTA